jgi:hypothetical protein
MDRRRFSTTMLAGGGGLFGATVGGGKAAAQDVPRDLTLETWTRSRRSRPVFAVNADRAKIVREIWNGYGLAAPNQYDKVETFCNAILADWARDRAAYVWRYASTSGRQVYVLPSRFLLAHPPFLPDFPDGYYRLDPTCEADDATSCIHPKAFFQILPGESVDEYAPGEVMPARG